MKITTTLPDGKTERLGLLSLLKWGTETNVPIWKLIIIAVMWPTYFCKVKLHIEIMDETNDKVSGGGDKERR
jgi:hypothetical protein